LVFLLFQWKQVKGKREQKVHIGVVKEDSGVSAEIMRTTDQKEGPWVLVPQMSEQISSLSLQTHQGGRHILVKYKGINIELRDIISK
jgi:hypothetical protein